jgi:hypothetical protein
MYYLVSIRTSSFFCAALSLALILSEYDDNNIVISSQPLSHISHLIQVAAAVTDNNTTKSDTVGAIMVPAKTVSQYISEFKGRGLEVDSTQQFNALRNASQQVLLVWTSNGMDLNKVLAALNQITTTLPYS